MIVGWEVFVKLLFALIFSGIIGFEREMKERPAGLRTHILVCLGSTMLTVVFLDAFASNIDSAARMSAAIMTGMGFLGAGTIINSNEHNHITGLTTAAGLWVVAGLGIAIGMGYYFVSAITVALILLVLELYSLEKYIHSRK